MSASGRYPPGIDDDKTVIRPSPGGRRRRASVESSHYRTNLDATADIDYLDRDNPFVTNSFSLLSIVSKLRNLPFHHAVDALRDQLAGEIRSFGERLPSQNISQEQIKIASYFLCALIDETVLNTPWGNQSSWGQQGLVVQFHGEAKGGERFFELIEKLRQLPSQNLNLIELAYICLSLGFEGKYRLLESGLRDLDQLRQELYLLIQRTKGHSEASLSAHWQGLRDRRAPIVNQFPLWVSSLIAGALLMVIYTGFAYAVNRSSNAVYQKLAQTAREKTPTIPVSNRPRTASVPSIDKTTLADRFEKLLASETARGMIEVVDGNLLRVANAFPSGSDQIKKEFVPMLAKIARELQKDTRLITVIGHTDNRPIFSARFPSNWHLSQARAKHVADKMIAAAPLNGRIRYEGHADSEPIVPNDTAANRARNRRIDIQFR